MSAVALVSLLGAGVAYYSSEEQRKAAEQGMQAQLDMVGRANAEQRRMYDLSKEEQGPWRTTGEKAIYSLADLMGQERTITKQRPINVELNAQRQSEVDDLNRQIASWQAEVDKTKKQKGRGSWQEKELIRQSIERKRDDILRSMAPETYEEAVPKSEQFGFLTKRFGAEDFQKEPGYEFRLGEGTKAIERAQAARGGFFSGAAGKALSRYGQDYASNEYGNAYNRFTQDQSNMYNRYAGLSGMGQTAAQQVSAANQTYGNQLGANYQFAGNALAQGYQNAAAARTSGYTGAYNQLLSGFGTYLKQKDSGNSSSTDTSSK